MKSLFYLLNMSLSGIKNIEKEIRLDFYGKNVDKNLDPTKYNVKGIYGENGVGKSAIVTAVDIVKSFVTTNDYLIIPQNQVLLKNLINKKTGRFYFRCEFASSFIGKLDIYEYEVELEINTSDAVCVKYETLSVKRNSSKNKKQVLFVSEAGRFTEIGEADSIRDRVIDKTQNLLVMQTAINLMIPIYGKEDKNTDFFRDVASAFVFFAMTDTYFDREDKHTDFYNNMKLKELRNQKVSAEVILDEVYGRRASSTSRVLVDDYKMFAKKVKKLEKFVKLFKPNLKRIEIDKKINENYYECELIMDYGDYKVNREFESTGIKKIIELYSALQRASVGGIVFVDEIDSNINDVYLCKMIEYFMYYGRGQLCFTSHNLDPMSVLKSNNKSIDFLVSDNRIIPWVKNGHYTPDNSYRNGMIAGMPYNIDPIDFIGIFEGEE